MLSLEGLRPLAVGGHWLPEMKVLAGGVDELQEPGAPAVSLRWEQVLTYAPEVLILAPCVSTSPEQTLAEIDKIAAQPGWWAMPAVRDREVYVVHHALFSRAGPRLVNGVELLARILHPSLAPDVKMRGGRRAQDVPRAGETVPREPTEEVFQTVGRRGAGRHGRRRRRRRA